MAADLQELYARAHVAPPFTVAGVRLGPFTLGHAISLEVLGQQELEEGDVAGLLLCLEVCRRAPSEFLARVQRRTFRIGLRLRAFFTGLFRSPVWLMREIPKFRDYCAHFSGMPALRRDETPGDESSPGTPFLHHLLVCLVSRLGYEREQAIALPLNVAYLEYAIHWEIEGRLELVGADSEASAAALADEADRLHLERLAKANALLGRPA